MRQNNAGGGGGVMHSLSMSAWDRNTLNTHTHPFVLLFTAQGISSSFHAGMSKV